MNKKILWGQILWMIMYLIIFVGATLFVADNYLDAENIKMLLFGAMLLLIFVREFTLESSKQTFVKEVQDE